MKNILTLPITQIHILVRSQPTDDIYRFIYQLSNHLSDDESYLKVNLYLLGYKYEDKDYFKWTEELINELQLFNRVKVNLCLVGVLHDSVINKIKESKYYNNITISSIVNNTVEDDTPIILNYRRELSCQLTDLSRQVDIEASNCMYCLTQSTSSYLEEPDFTNLNKSQIEYLFSALDYSKSYDNSLTEAILKYSELILFLDTSLNFYTYYFSNSLELSDNLIDILALMMIKNEDSSYTNFLEMYEGELNKAYENL